MKPSLRRALSSRPKPRRDLLGALQSNLKQPSPKIGSLVKATARVVASLELRKRELV